MPRVGKTMDRKAALRRMEEQLRDERFREASTH